MAFLWALFGSFVAQKSGPFAHTQPLMNRIILVEKSDTVLRNLLCPSGEQCTVDRSNKGLGLI